MKLSALSYQKRVLNLVRRILDYLVKYDTKPFFKHEVSQETLWCLYLYFIVLYDLLSTRQYNFFNSTHRMSKF